MINEEKVKIMTKLAMYEQGKGRKYLPVSRYYRSDYIGLALIKNFTVFGQILPCKEECQGVLQSADFTE